jgi:hypothetical protein
MSRAVPPGPITLEGPQVDVEIVDGEVVRASTCRLIQRPGTDGSGTRACAVIEAGFITDELSFDEAKRYLEPGNWQFPGSIWIRMERAEQLGTASWRYHETVRAPEPMTAGTDTLSTDLQFWFSHPTSDEARLEYDLAPGLPVPGSDIEIDEGSFRVVRLADGRVHITSTKRVRFAPPFDGPGQAVIMSAVGYSAVLKEMVFAIAKAPPGAAAPFPVEPDGTVLPLAPDAVGRVPAAERPIADPGVVAGRTRAFLEAYLEGAAESMRSSADAMRAGTYTADSAWSDGLRLWETYLNGLAAALKERR